MKKNPGILYPITFNCWKHHTVFIKKRIKLYRNKNVSAEELKNILLVIGEAQMDLYFGELSTQKICNEIIRKLKTHGALAFAEYKKWLSEKGDEYKLVEISDNSVWALRLGNEKEKYVHIHPGRHSPLTIRVKAATLKTAIATLTINYKKNISLTNTLRINKIREEMLNLPPVKKVSSNSAVVRIINIIS